MPRLIGGLAEDRSARVLPDRGRCPAQPVGRVPSERRVAEAEERFS